MNDDNTFDKLRKFLPPVCMIGAIIFMFIDPGGIVKNTLSSGHMDPLPAALMLLVLYALKSMTVIFPILALQIAAGHLLSTPVAIAVNILGMAICISVPFFLGRLSGTEKVEKLVDKYPKFSSIIKMQNKSTFFTCFILRALGFLPGDLISMYLGATGVPYTHTLFGGLLGTSVGVVLATIFGSSIKDPGSMAFWLSLMLMCVISISSIIWFYFWEKKSCNDI